MGRLIPLFLYGSARPNEPLWSSIESSVKDWKFATTNRAKLMVDANGRYPYLVKTDRALDQVYGDLVLIEYGIQIKHLVAMELAAGYNLEAITVSHSFGKVRPTALAFTWPSNDTADLIDLGNHSWLAFRIRTQHSESASINA